MRKSILLLIGGALVLLTAACSSDQYTVKGTVEGLEGTIYLIDDTGAAIDSAAIDDGSFSITRKFEGPAYYSLRDSKEGAPSFTAKFFVAPGEITVESHEVTMVFGRDVDNPQKRLFGIASGTPANDAFNAMTDSSRELMDEARDPDITAERQDELEFEYSQLVKAAYDANKDNIFGAYLLSQSTYDMTGKEILEEIADFPKEIQNSRILTKLHETAEQMAKTEIGGQYLEVVANDPEGNAVSLSSAVENPANKYVLLDFWASWCGPCMREVPYLTKTYAEFHDKGFEIYGVSFDTDADKWTAAVADNGMNWIHVSELHRFDNQAAKDYAIQAIPANRLINCADGTLVAFNLRGDDLYDTVSELFAE